MEIIGKLYGRGRVIRRLANDKYSQKRWELQCRCGNLYTATTGTLNSGNTKSCGCLGKETTKNINWKGCGKIPKTYFNHLKISVLKRNIEFNIDIEQIWELFIEQNGLCSLSNQELYFTTGKKRGTASLDRINPSKGYILDNLQWIHKNINKAKNNFDQNTFIDICRSVSSFNAPPAINIVKPKIVIFGGGGYIGNVLCRKLLDIGYRVKCVDNFHKGQCDALIPLMHNQNFEFKKGDITIEKDIKDNIEDVDAIINLAAIVGFPACDKQPSLAKAVNEDAAKKIVELKKENIPMFFASTGSVYGQIEGVCTEESETNPQSLYGITKLNAEQYISQFDNTLCYRFATCFGVSPNMRVNLLVNDFVYNGINNQYLVIFQPLFRRTFIHITDFVNSVVYGLENMQNFSHKIYNVGSNDLNWTKKQIAELISHKTGCSIFYGDFAKDQDLRDYEVSYKKINNEGFRCNISMEEGIDELIKTTPLLQVTHRYM